MATSAWCRLILAVVAAVTTSATQYPLKFADDRLHALIPIRIGTPPQNLTFIVDTSTSDLVIFTDSSICGSQCFNHTRSSSFRTGTSLGVDTSRAAFELEIDGATVNNSGRTMVGTDIVRVGDDLQATLVYIGVDKLQIWRGSGPDRFQTFQGVDGLIGLAYSSLQRVYCLDPHDESCTQFRRLAGLDTGHFDIFTLDLGEETPVLGIGNISDEYKPVIQWGSQNPYDKPYVHRFTVFDLTVCGANLFANYSGHQWEALIDTGASCLRLPAEFFDMVMAWIPSVHYDSEPMPCWVPANATKTLPKLTFQLNPAGPLLFLPLDQLLLPMGNGSARLCISRDIPIAQSMESPPSITFGALAMRAFYAAFDLEAVRFGMANRLSLNTTMPETCSAVVQCHGQQRRWIPMNRCLDPDCTGYLVRHFDSATKTCTLFFASEMVVYVMVGSLLLAELTLHALYWRQCRKIIASVPSY